MKELDELLCRKEIATRREDERAALICATVVNLFVKKGGRRFTIDDFIGRASFRAEKPQTRDEQIAFAKALTKARNGEIK